MTIGVASKMNLVVENLTLLFFPKQFTVRVLNSFLKRCVAWARWCCPALRISRIHMSPLVAIHLSPSLAGGVRLFGCLQFNLFVAGGFRGFGCLQFTCLLSEQVVCFPIWLVVSGSLAVCFQVSPNCVALVSDVSRVVFPDVVSQMLSPSCPKVS